MCVWMLIKFKVHLIWFGAKRKSGDQRYWGFHSSIFWLVITRKRVLVLEITTTFYILPGITLQHGICGTLVDFYLILILLNMKMRAVASELQKLVTENLGTCTCLLNGDHKMPKAFGLHFWIGLAHNSSTLVQLVFRNYLLSNL